MTVDEQLECGLRARLDAAGTEAQAEIVWLLEVTLESQRAGRCTHERDAHAQHGGWKNRSYDEL